MLSNANSFAPFCTEILFHSPVLSLHCAVVGTRTVFPVEINEDLSVGCLKEVIKEKSEDIKCFAHELQLFLARKPVEEEGGKEVIPVYRLSEEKMKEEKCKWLPDEHRAALKSVKGESDDYINALIAEEQILASKAIATWFYTKNNMGFPSSDHIHVLVVIPKVPWRQLSSQLCQR